MDLTDTPDDLPADDEEPPDFESWMPAADVLNGGPIRERMLDVIVGLREPTKVSTIATRADCDIESARDYLEWLEEMGMVRELSGRPVQYERNDSYLRWRRIERIRTQYSEIEVVARLKETLEATTEYRERFDADSPDNVSLDDESYEESVEKVWKALSEWRALEQRAALLDSALLRWSETTY